MAIRHVSYMDLPDEILAHAAERTRKQIRTMLAGNFLTPDQVTYLNHRLEVIDQWEKKRLYRRKPAALPQEKETPALPERTPTHHEVGVSDDVEFGEEVG